MHAWGVSHDSLLGEHVPFEGEQEYCALEIFSAHVAASLKELGA